MRENTDAIQKENVSIVAIVPTDGHQIQGFLDAFGPYPFTILGDPQQQAYKKLGLKHMSKWVLLSQALFQLATGKVKLYPDDPKQKQVVAKAIKTQDMYQQGGTWLFSETGEVEWSHLDANPSDHATIEMILERIQP